MVETYEVRVNVKLNGTEHYSPHVGKYIEDEITKMVHILARTGKQAMRKAEKYGHPISVRKADAQRMRGNAEDTKLDDLPDYSYPVMLDEMVWLKRNKRIENQQKDKDTS